MAELTHFDEQGRARMVDVGQKPITRRSATASARVRMQPNTLKMIQDRQLAKGDVLSIARIAGISASKKTAELVPLCHPLPLDSVEIDFSMVDEQRLQIVATVHTTGRTGVEMEALTSVTVAAITVYDMCKSVDRSMTIEQVQLEQKSGGASGDFVRDDLP